MCFCVEHVEVEAVLKTTVNNETLVTYQHTRYYVKLLFIVLSLAAALLLPMSCIMVSQKLDLLAGTPRPCTQG